MEQRGVIKERHHGIITPDLVRGDGAGDDGAERAFGMGSVCRSPVLPCSHEPRRANSFPGHNRAATDLSRRAIGRESDAPQ
ncbi:MAG: hypothetical protein ACR2OH_06490 [Microthrixaceae bacterium]